MREIKFRLFSFGKFKYFSTPEDFKWLFGENGQTTKLSNCNLEQYTGLKDKNGVEIYEGDLLKSYDEHGNIDVDKVIYNTSHCKFMLVSDSESRLPIGLGEYSSFTLEVIGNIHEALYETTM